MFNNFLEWASHAAALRSIYDGFSSFIGNTTTTLSNRTTSSSQEAIADALDLYTTTPEGPVGNRDLMDLIYCTNPEPFIERKRFSVPEPRSRDAYDTSQYTKRLNELKSYLSRHPDKHIFDFMSADEVLKLYNYFIPDPNKPKDFNKYYETNTYLYKRIGEALVALIQPSNITDKNVQEIADKFPVAGFISGLDKKDRKSEQYYEDLSRHLLLLDQKPELERQAAIVEFSRAHNPKTLSYIKARLGTRNPFRGDMLHIIRQMYRRSGPINSDQMTRQESAVAKLVIEQIAAASQGGNIAIQGPEVESLVAEHFGIRPGEATRTIANVTEMFHKCATQYPRLSRIINPHIAITNAEQLLRYLHSIERIDHDNVARMLSIIPSDPRKFSNMHAVYSRVADMEVTAVDLTQNPQLAFIGAPEVLYACIRDGKKANPRQFSGSLVELANQHNHHLSTNTWYKSLLKHGYNKSILEASLCFAPVPMAAIGYYWLFNKLLTDAIVNVSNAIAVRSTACILFIAPVIIVGVFAINFRQTLNRINGAVSFLEKVNQEEAKTMSK
jgi:hypothetical protein